MCAEFRCEWQTVHWLPYECLNVPYSPAYWPALRISRAIKNCLEIVEYYDFPRIWRPLIYNVHLHIHVHNKEHRVLLWRENLKKNSSHVLFLRPTTTLYTFMRNAKRTDMLNTMHTCIKAFRLSPCSFVHVKSNLCTYKPYPCFSHHYLSYKYILYAKNTECKIYCIYSQQSYSSKDHKWMERYITHNAGYSRTTLHLDWVHSYWIGY